MSVEKSIYIRFKGAATELASALGRARQNIQAFSKDTIATFRTTDQKIKAFADAHVSSITAMMGGVSAGLIAKQQIDFQSRLVRMKIEGRATAEQMSELKDNLFSVGKAMHQDPGDLLSGVDRIVEKIGNFKFAKEHLEGMAMAATATGASMEDIGSLASDLKQKFGIDKELVESIDILFAQGKTGAFRFQDFATQGERITAAASSMLGLKGVQGVRQMGALLQMAKSATGSPEEAATSFENFAREIIKNAKPLGKLGINVWDPVASKKAGRNVVKDVTEIMRDIDKKTNFDPKKLSKVFDIRSYRLIASFVDNFNQNNGMARYLALVNEKTGELSQGFKEYSNTAAAQLTSLTAAAKEFANITFTGPLKGLTKLTEYLNDNPALTQALLGTTSLAVGGLLLRRVLPATLGGKTGTPGGEGVAGMLGVQKVFVTNFPAGLGGAAAGAAGGAAGAAGGAAEAEAEGVTALEVAPSGATMGIATATEIILAAVATYKGMWMKNDSDKAWAQAAPKQRLWDEAARHDVMGVSGTRNMYHEIYGARFRPRQLSPGEQTFSDAALKNHADRVAEQVAASNSPTKTPAELDALGRNFATVDSRAHPGMSMKQDINIYLSKDGIEKVSSEGKIPTNITVNRGKH